MQGSAVRPLAPFILGLAAAVLPPSGAAQLPPPPQPWLRVHATVQFFATGTKWIDQDLFVSTSGYSQAVGTFGNSIDPLEHWIYTANTATASAEALSALRAALDTGHIGLQASCALNPSFLVDGNAELTWYGRRLRRNDLTVVLTEGTSDLPTCPPELCQILGAIEAYAQTVHKLATFPLRCP